MSDPVYLVRLGRPSHGDTIHKSTCRYAKRPNALRWTFAETNPDYDWHREAPWLKRCQVCMPPSPFGTYEFAGEPRNRPDRHWESDDHSAL